MAKQVIKNPKVFLNPTTDGTPSGTTGGTDVSVYFTKFGITLARTEVDVQAFGDIGDATEKASNMHKVDVEYFNSAVFGDFTALMITELGSNSDTIFLFKDDANTFTDARPGYLVRVKVCTLGDLFGAKNTASKGTTSWKVQGQVTILKASTAILV